MSFNYIVTTCEPQLNLSVPLDESSLEPYPPRSPPTPTSEEASVESAIEGLNNCIKTVADVQDKLSDCALTKLDLINALEFTLYELKKVKSRLRNC